MAEGTRTDIVKSPLARLEYRGIKGLMKSQYSDLHLSQTIFPNRQIRCYAVFTIVEQYNPITLISSRPLLG